MRTYAKIILFFLLAALLLSACSKKSTPTSTLKPTANDAGIANPASVNCEEKGGILSLRDRIGIGTIGVCVFDGTHQCEEWALFRGECPLGGVDISGYATDAAVFCVISGGEYAVTGNNGAADERGTCTLKNGTTCNVWEFYAGTCNAVQ